MKYMLVLVTLLFAIPAWSGNLAKPGKCEDAMKQTKILAAHHNWSASGAVDSPVIELSTEGPGVGKQVGVSAATLGFGSFFMIPKQGRLLFEQEGDTCKINSHGKPADKLLNELKKEK